MKDFRTEIETLYTRLQNKDHFSFSKFADGEWMAMRGMNMNNNEFSSNVTSSNSKQLLIDSFKYVDENYIVGVSCKCCVGNKDHTDMVTFSGQPETNLTFANIFVNSNYQYFKDNFISEFKNYNINLIANENSTIDKLPFGVKRFYPIKKNAWVENLSLISELKTLNTENELYLFCAGPFGNILAHQLWENNKNNTYMDIGSTLNPWLNTEGFRRSYLHGGSDLNKKCIW